MPTYPNPTDPVSALTRADGSTEAHSRDHGRMIGVWENVKYHGARGNGSTNDSVAIQAAIDAGGVTYFPPGTYMCNVIVKPNTKLVGAGRRQTTLKAVAGSNNNVISGLNYASLEAKGYAVGDYLLGSPDVEIRDMTIDGNKANMTSGVGIRIWGKGLRFRDITVQNCKSGGIYTQFTTHESGALDQDPRGTFENIICQSNTGNGWTYRGPHDSIISNFMSYSNTGWGFFSDYSGGTPYYNGGVSGIHWNSWLNNSGSLYFDGTLVELTDAAATGANVGNGIEIGSQSGGARMKGIIIAGHVNGLVLRGAHHEFQGEVQACGLGIQMNATQACDVAATGYGLTTAISIVGALGGDIIRGTFNLGSGTTLLNGTPHSTGIIQLAHIGGLGNATVTYLGDMLIMRGAGTPLNNVAAEPGSMYHSTDGNIYRKSTGSGTTGWVTM